MLFNANCRQRCVKAVETAQGPSQAATARSVVYLVSPSPPSLALASSASLPTRMHALFTAVLPILRQIEQPSVEDAASLTAALLAVEGAVLADEVLASQSAARLKRAVPSK